MVATHFQLDLPVAVVPLVPTPVAHDLAQTLLSNLDRRLARRCATVARSLKDLARISYDFLFNGREGRGLCLPTYIPLLHR